MDRDTLSELITTEDVIDLLENTYGSIPHKVEHSSGALIFSCVCHGDLGKRKLYYYPSSKVFNCYCCCGVMSIYDLIMEIEGCNFTTAFKQLCEYKGVSTASKKVVGFIPLKQDYLKEDWEILSRHLNKDKPKVTIPQLPSYSNGLLTPFDRIIPQSWIDDGISEEVFYEFNCRFSKADMCCLIPHYDMWNNLIGIRSRNFMLKQLEQGMKYIPYTLQGMTYRFPSHYNLFGINKNQKAIKQYKKVVLVEGEKGVMQYASMFGLDKNLALATMGTSFSEVQKKMILNLGVEEVIIAYDKQWIDAELVDKSSRTYKDFVRHIGKMRKIYNMLRDFVNVSVILCWDNRLDYKDSPLDKGKEVFLELLHERYYIEEDEDFEEIIK